MRKNITGAGRIIRGVVGIIIIAVGWYFHSWWAAVGIIPLGEAIFGWCVFLHFCRNKECKKE